MCCTVPAAYVHMYRITLGAHTTHNCLTTSTLYYKEDRPGCSDAVTVTGAAAHCVSSTGDKAAIVLAVLTAKLLLPQTHKPISTYVYIVAAEITAQCTVALEGKSPG